MINLHRISLPTSLLMLGCLAVYITLTIMKLDIPVWLAGILTLFAAGSPRLVKRSRAQIERAKK